MYSAEALLPFVEPVLLLLVVIMLAVVARKVGNLTRRRAGLTEYQLVGEISTLREELTALRRASLQPRLAHVYPDLANNIVHFAFSDGTYLSRDNDGHFLHLGKPVSDDSPYRKHIEMIEPGYFAWDE